MNNFRKIVNKIPNDYENAGISCPSNFQHIDRREPIAEEIILNFNRVNCIKIIKIK